MKTVKKLAEGFPGTSVVKNLAANAGDTRSIPDLGRSHVPRSNKARAPNYGTSAVEPTESCCPGAHTLQEEKPQQ